jgi:membrane associated rhomboid family serine protease
MFIIPVSRQPDWRHPPFVTLFLILLNCLIYFGPQSDDPQRRALAYRYYAESELPKIELPHYLDHLKQLGETRRTTLASVALAEENWLAVFQMMQNDEVFMQRLRSGKIILADTANYDIWRQQRTEFDRLYQATMLDRFGFKPAEPTLSGLIGHMFLHSSFDHLIGNLAILFIVGYMVEEALGSTRFLAFYLLAGIGAAGFDWVFNSARILPGIGASGAISGVMAMFVVLYGMQKIRFLYWIIFYFDFFRAPAIAVLPFWIANEIYQYLFDQESGVNYIAHLGGFLCGAALILAQRKFGKNHLSAPASELPGDPLPAELARIDTLLGALRIDTALQALRSLAEQYPYDLSVVSRYYKVARNTPASEDFHKAAGLVFELPDEPPADTDFVHETFVEYLQLAKPSVRFSIHQLIALIRRLARAAYVDDAERLSRVLAQRAPQAPQLPDLLLLVAAACQRTGNEALRDVTLSRLQKEFPSSEAARNAVFVVG